MAAFVDKYDPRRGHQCPRCGHGRLKEATTGRHCALCGYIETLIFGGGDEQPAGSGGDDERRHDVQ